MKNILILLLGSLLFGACQNKEKDDTSTLALLLIYGQPKVAANVVQNVKAVSTSTGSVKLTWDDYSGAIVYNVYYTCSPSTQAATVPAITTVTDPIMVTASTGAVTSNGVTTGTEACSVSVVNIVKKADSPLTISVKKLGIPYKFVVTAVNSSGETTPSTPGELVEAAPTQAQRLRGIYVVGGLSALYANTVSRIDLYDQDTSTWFTGVSSLPTPVSFAGIVSEKSKIFVVGGFNATGALPGTTQVYDILTNAWSNKTVGPASTRANAGATSFNGKLYFLGGTTVSATTAWAGSLLTDVYDLASDSWSVGIPFGAAGSERSAVTVDGVIYNSGGRTAAAALGLTHDGVIISTNTLTGVGVVEVPLTTARNGHSLVTYKTTSGSEIWSIGGCTVLTTQAAAGVLAAATTVYTPSLLVQSLAAPFGTGVTWLTTPPQLATATGFGSAVVDQRNGDVYYSGGDSVTGTPLAPVGNTTFFKSNITTKAAWSTLTAMPTGRWGHTVVIPNQ